MEQKTWSQLLKEGVKFSEIVFSVPPMDINSWLEKSKAEGLTDIEQQSMIRCADRFDRITFDALSPAGFAAQWQNTVTA